ncbi:hypothetical protein Cgig2_001738 [Carnegiea gigantea]|uniref:Uncharacterized protein n=1 Tax=Carnegiea gigantea TaxID=171969 RepID=A0A9Q1JJN5_9CARY|nr:hypothetical protein Cgig2_001738 [Carnegiea gigantea]
MYLIPSTRFPTRSTLLCPNYPPFLARSTLYSHDSSKAKQLWGLPKVVLSYKGGYELFRSIDNTHYSYGDSHQATPIAALEYESTRSRWIQSKSLGYTTNLPWIDGIQADLMMLISKNDWLLPGQPSQHPAQPETEPPIPSDPHSIHMDELLACYLIEKIWGDRIPLPAIIRKTKKDWHFVKGQVDYIDACNDWNMIRFANSEDRLLVYDLRPTPSLTRTLAQSPELLNGDYPPSKEPSSSTYEATHLTNNWVTVQDDNSTHSDNLIAMVEDVEKGMDADENVDMFLNLENIEDVEMSTNSTEIKRIEEGEEYNSHT